MFLYDKGIKINGSSLWLDAARKVETCIVSHAHMDHARKHRMIIATQPTLDFLARRLGKTPAVSLRFGEPYAFEGGQATLYPAGHILGSAQILVELDGRRLLYSGDFNLETSAAAEPIEVPQCDILVMESTFGQPRYRFPKRELVVERLFEFVRTAMRDGFVPVVAGYALGKSQEAMKLLADAGFRVSVHGSVAALARIYETHGVRFGTWEKCDKRELEGKVLVVPRAALSTRLVQQLDRKRVVFLSGWAVASFWRRPKGVDLMLPLSDHADFAGLVSYVRRTRARKIYTTHGFRDFPRHLRALGFDALAVDEMRQLSLF